MLNTLQEEKEKLNERERLIMETEVFWGNLAQVKMSEFHFVGEKLKEAYSDELYERFERLAKELKHLDQKKDFELREYKKLQKDQEIFVKKSEKDLMTELTGKLSKKFSERKKKKIDS